MVGKKKFIIPTALSALMLPAFSEEPGQALNKDLAVKARQMESRAVTCREHHQYAQAESLYKQALSLWHDCLGQNGRAVKASELQSTAGTKKSDSTLLLPAPPPDSFQVNPVANNREGLGLLYGDWGKWQQAADSYKNALELEKNTLNANNPSRAITMRNYAQALRKLGKYKEAQSLEQQAAKIAPALQ